MLRKTHGGRNLLSINLGADLGICAAMDTHPVLPLYDPVSGEIRLAG
jgi:hypothetical protein